MFLLVGVALVAWLMFVACVVAIFRVASRGDADLPRDWLE
jgi:hypothetical protein